MADRGTLQDKHDGSKTNKEIKRKYILDHLECVYGRSEM